MTEEEEFTRREAKKIIRQCKKIARNCGRIRPRFYAPNGIVIPIISSLLFALVITLMICLI